MCNDCIHCGSHTFDLSFSGGRAVLVQWGSSLCGDVLIGNALPVLSDCPFGSEESMESHRVGAGSRYISNYDSRRKFCGSHVWRTLYFDDHGTGTDRPKPKCAPSVGTCLRLCPRDVFQSLRTGKYGSTELFCRQSLWLLPVSICLFPVRL